jgi:HD-GYP domain-containing protein (c-di-GMP phosphodiesterase class II)
VEGPDLQCLALRTLLDGRDLHRSTPALPVAVILIFGALSVLFLPRLGALPLLAWAALLILFLSGASALLYVRLGLILPVTAPSCALACCALLLAHGRTGALAEELDAGAALVDEVSKSSRWKEDPAGWLGNLLEIAIRTLGAQAGWIALAGKDGDLLIAASHKTRAPESPDEMQGGICEESLRTGAQRIVEDLHEERKISSFERRQHLDTLLVFPMKGTKETLGLIAVGKRFPGRFTQGHARQLSSLAVLAGALYENVRLSGRLQDLFIDSISSLAKAVDARDPYTFGHSSRVSEYGRRIAEGMGLPSEEVRKIELAGILHDIGKIGIPESVLRKPEKLTDEEFAIMRRHPDIAVSILEPLNEIYALLPVIGGHHEKIDGTGYPKGLRSEEIPQAAKILAVADVYDALTSERPYRKPSTPEEALSIMRRHFSSHIDMEILEVFERLVASGNINVS